MTKNRGSLDKSEVAEALQQHVSGLRATAVELSNRFESDSGPAAEHVNAVRTELTELVGMLEDVVADECDETVPYERVGEFLISRGRQEPSDCCHTNSYDRFEERPSTEEPHRGPS